MSEPDAQEGPPRTAALASDALAWALQAVVNDLGSMASVFVLLRDELGAARTTAEALEAAQAMAEGAEAIAARLDDLRTLAAGDQPSPVQLDKALASVLRVVGSALRRTSRIEVEPLEPVPVRAPRALLARALVVGLFGVAGAPRASVGTLRLSVERRGDRAVVTLRGEGFNTNRVPSTNALLTEMLGAHGTVEAEVSASPTLYLTFPVTG